MAKKILLVDDDHLLLKVWGDKFRNSGFEVFTANDGEKGMEVAFKEHPDLILLDILMPKVDGMEMLKKVRKDKWGEKAEIMLLTNLFDVEKISAALDMGVYEYMIKSDWRPEDVVMRIKEKLAKKGKR